MERQDGRGRMNVVSRIYSSRDFNQDVAGAKRAAREGPVIVTDRGEPAFVLMTHAEYASITAKRKTLLDIFADTGPADDIEFEPERFDVTPRAVDFE